MKAIVQITSAIYQEKQKQTVNAGRPLYQNVALLKTHLDAFVVLLFCWFTDSLQKHSESEQLSKKQEKHHLLNIAQSTY